MPAPMRQLAVLALVSVACAAQKPSDAPTRGSPAGAPRLPPRDPVTSPSSAPAPDPFESDCPGADRSLPIRLTMGLDGVLDWSRPPEDLARDFAAVVRKATAACEGARVEDTEARAVRVSLPAPCGAERVSGTLEAWFLPHGGRSLVSARFETKIGNAELTGKAFVDPADRPGTACVTAELSRLRLTGSGKRQVGDPEPTAGDEMAAAVRRQRAFLELFFPVLWLAPKR